jgi:hypothetical protein
MRAKLLKPDAMLGLRYGDKMFDSYLGALTG